MVIMTHQTLSLEKYWKLLPATLMAIVKTGTFSGDFLKVKVCGIPDREDSWRRVKPQINLIRL